MCDYLSPAEELQERHGSSAAQNPAGSEPSASLSPPKHGAGTRTHTPHAPPDLGATSGRSVQKLVRLCAFNSWRSQTANKAVLRLQSVHPVIQEIPVTSIFPLHLYKIYSSNRYCKILVSSNWSVSGNAKTMYCLKHEIQQFSKINVLFL